MKSRFVRVTDPRLYGVIYLALYYSLWLKGRKAKAQVMANMKAIEKAQKWQSKLQNKNERSLL
jgi:hypothetical protein